MIHEYSYINDTSVYNTYIVTLPKTLPVNKYNSLYQFTLICSIGIIYTFILLLVFRTIEMFDKNNNQVTEVVEEAAEETTEEMTEGAEEEVEEAEEVEDKDEKEESSCCELCNRSFDQDWIPCDKDVCRKNDREEFMKKEDMEAAMDTDEDNTIISESEEEIQRPPLKRRR